MYRTSVYINIIQIIRSHVNLIIKENAGIMHINHHILSKMETCRVSEVHKIIDANPASGRRKRAVCRVHTNSLEYALSAVSGSIIIEEVSPT